DVAEPPVADPLDVRAAALDPVAVDELALGAAGDGEQLDVARLAVPGPDPEHDLAAGRIAQEQVDVGVPTQARAADGDDLVARLDAAGDVRRAELDDLAHDEPAALLVFVAVEA